MIDTDQLREEIRRERERLDSFERKLDAIDKTHIKILEVMQGDAAWKRKGVIDQLAEVAAFMAEMKGFDFLEMRTFANEYNDFKKRALWLAGGIVSLITVLGLLTSNIDKIQNFFHH